MRIGADSSLHLMSSSPWLITLQGVWIYLWRMVHQVDTLHSRSANVDNPVINRVYFQRCGIAQGAGRTEQKITWAYEQVEMRSNICSKCVSFENQDGVPFGFLKKWYSYVSSTGFSFFFLFLSLGYVHFRLEDVHRLSKLLKPCIWIRRALCWWVWAIGIPWVGGFLSWHIGWAVSRTLGTTTKACTKYYGLRAFSVDYCWDLEPVIRWTEQLHIL